jgi:hypothetical protein
LIGQPGEYTGLTNVTVYKSRVESTTAQITNALKTSIWASYPNYPKRIWAKSQKGVDSRKQGW